MLDRNFQKQVQLAFYLVHKFGNNGVPIIKAVKMIFLADVYAMRYYARCVTGDTYYAMTNGPVASNLDTILEQQNEFLGSVDRLKYVQQFLEREQGNSWSIVRVKSNHKQSDLDCLSELDEEAIDYVFEHYKDKTPQELIDITHQYKAWQNKKDKLQDGRKRVKINIEDIFENDGEIAVSDSDIQTSRTFYGRA